MPDTSMQETLDMAILAMHAYNRGENSHLLLDDDVGSFSAVSIGQTGSNLIQLPDGFDAAVYSNGQKIVIAIRGTNPTGEGTADAVSGYPIAVGWGIRSATQQQDALDLYKQIVDQTGQTPLSNDISLTGHSLGGGLAGYISGLYGKTATIFDAMPYESSSLNDYNAAINGIYTTAPDGSLIYIPPDANLKANLYGLGSTPVPSFNGVNNYYTKGEFLASFRYFQSSGCQSARKWSPGSARNGGPAVA